LSAEQTQTVTFGMPTAEHLAHLPGAVLVPSLTDASRDRRVGRSPGDAQWSAAPAR